MALRLFRPASRSQRGVTIVEFALVAPFLVILVFGLIDFARIIQANTSVAEAARQASRQAAANANDDDKPFGAADSNPCQGTNFSSGATGQGCLTDTRIFATAESLLSAGGLDRSICLHTAPAGCFANTSAATCVATNPPAGQARICLSPSQGGSAATYASCSVAEGPPPGGLGHFPLPGDLGGRQAEWTNPKYQTGNCFLVQVTVVYTYKPVTGLLQGIIGNSIHLTSSTSTVAEY
jgi:Flp pilus assembly protein TadG